MQKVGPNLGNKLMSAYECNHRLLSVKEDEWRSFLEDSAVEWER